VAVHNVGLCKLRQALERPVFADELAQMLRRGLVLDLSIAMGKLQIDLKPVFSCHPSSRDECIETAKRKNTKQRLNEISKKSWRRISRSRKMKADTLSTR
jgi:hypothetical protein